ncbi:MAG: DUF3662 and FHA domain-containing protein [Mycobacteriaceae bacterium]|uniref:DUF3662 and FHA domain-containing protein n=1 Tax=Corynebacterium sp. TaxID=1720 RepID=UPI003F9CFE10
MDLFGRFRKLDSSLQRGLDNGFARVFGGEVVPAEIDELLKQEVEDTLMEDSKGKIVAASSYVVHVSKHDHDALLEKRPELADELRGRLHRFIRNEGWESPQPVSVEILEDDGLHTGQLKSRSSFDPPAGSSTEPPESPDSRGANDNEPHWPRSEPDSGRNPVARPYDAKEADGQDDAGRPGAGAAGAAGAAAAGAAGAAGAAANPLTGLARPAQPAERPTREPVPEPRTPDPEPEPDPPMASYPGTEVISHKDEPPARTGDSATGAADAAAAGEESAPQTTVTLFLQDGSARNYVLQNGANVIGRGNNVDFRLPDTGVSRQHAEITWDGYDAVLTDLKSTNGTTVNDIPVENWLLADGDVVTIGHSEIEVRFS